MTTRIAAPRAGTSSTATAAHQAVPWPTVLALAVALAYSDGFWTTSLREAVGSIERTSAPFESWVRESTTLVPVFALAVLGAMVLARRRFGPELRGRTLLAGALLVVAAGTLAGVAELAVSSFYDYRLQVAHLQTMGSMGGRCVGACLEGAHDATLALQVKSVAYGSGILLISNLVVVGWVLALLGGRLRLERPARAPRRAVARFDDLRVVVATALVGSAVIHVAVVPEHLEEWAAAGLFFVVLALAQLVAAGFVLHAPHRLVWIGVALLAVGPLAVWVYSRTLGMPFGPEAGEPELVGLADVAAGALELVTLVAAVVVLRAHGWIRRAPASTHVNRLAVVAMVAVTALGLGSALTMFGDAGHGHSGAETSEQAEA